MEDIRYLITQGKTYFRNQAYKKAEEIFLKIISGKNEFADVYNMLGVIYHQTGQFSKAISFFERALKINPLYTEALINLSVLYNDLGEYKKAKHLIQKSEKANKKTGEDKLDPFIKGKLANKHAEAGDLYRGVGLYKHAITEYEKALRFAPYFHDIRVKLGICLREDGRKKDALKEFQKIVKDKPQFADGHMQIGITLYSLGQKTKAREVWDHLSKINPKHQLAQMYLRLSAEHPKISVKGSVSKKGRTAS